jgi:hypothetical protein
MGLRRKRIARRSPDVHWFETAAPESGVTTIAFAPHHEEHERSNDDWKKLGETLRQAQKSRAQ